ncbi:hypothetical protein AHF37_06442 [Paragonimus kellicotti]|nr:hypothetical protein AHF37_06442 [Paragonimus kellicotti]
MLSIWPGYFLAVCSGLLAALASVWGKLFSTSVKSSLWFNFIVGYTLYVGVNLVMWVVFAAALKTKGKCVVTLGLNCLANFGFSAMFGVLLFGETLSLQWLIGMIFLCVGTVCLLRDS